MPEAGQGDAARAGEPAVVPGELDPFVRSMLVCPRCRGELVDVDGGLCCEVDGLIYPIVEGVPWMIEERARPVPG